MNMRKLNHINILKPHLFQQRLLKWFNHHGRTHLPWQQHKTPYRVWVSEIMLQQTQVNTVIPYFERFVAAFANVGELANADEDEVMHLWAGLGYYSRARNLHKAAKMIMNTFAGFIPNKIEDLLKLPGIGESTAGAILSLAFNQPATILDGNVKRVLARFHGITTPIDEQSTLEKLWRLAERYTPKKSLTANYTQAMMDLGAMLCTRKNPQCHLCPVQKYCIAYHDGTIALIPRKKAARKIPVRKATFMIIKNGNYILLQKRPSPGIWGGLWSFPEIEGQPNSERMMSFCFKHFRIKSAHYQMMATFRHTFTHYHLDIFPMVMELKAFPRKIMAGCKQIWYNLDGDIAVGLPKPVQTLISTFAQRKT